MLADEKPRVEWGCTAHGCLVRGVANELANAHSDQKILDRAPEQHLIDWHAVGARTMKGKVVVE